MGLFSRGGPQPEVPELEGEKGEERRGGRGGGREEFDQTARKRKGGRRNEFAKADSTPIGRIEDGGDRRSKLERKRRVGGRESLQKERRGERGGQEKVMGTWATEEEEFGPQLRRGLKGDLQSRPIWRFLIFILGCIMASMKVEWL